MDVPFLLLVLLALPFALAVIIVAVSSARRRRRYAAGSGPWPESVHRGQADTAAVQSAAPHPPTAARKVTSGRDRRARMQERPTDR